MKKKHEQNSRTHFEQIPLEVVKRIVKVDVSRDEKAGTDNMIVERVSRKSEPNRVLARSRDRKRR
jgi:hypothetical protein